MSIIDASDESESIISVDKFYSKIDKLTDICLVTFSYHVIDKILERFEHKEVAYVATANGHIPLYYLEELKIITYLSPISAPVSATILEEVNYITSCNKFIFFGSCGILDKQYKNKFIIPTKSYREEGFSYHYLPPQDYIDIKNYEFIKDICDKNDINYVSGPNWTTDAIYKETVNKFNKRKEEGCISVEMEASALQALCDYKNIDLYIFFFAGDLLDEKEYEPGDLVGLSHKMKQIDSLDLGLLIVDELQK